MLAFPLPTNLDRAYTTLVCRTSIWGFSKPEMQQRMVDAYVAVHEALALGDVQRAAPVRYLQPRTLMQTTTHVWRTPAIGEPCGAVMHTGAVLPTYLFAGAATQRSTGRCMHAGHLPSLACVRCHRSMCRKLCSSAWRARCPGVAKWARCGRAASSLAASMATRSLTCLSATALLCLFAGLSQVEWRTAVPLKAKVGRCSDRSSFRSISAAARASHVVQPRRFPVPQAQPPSPPRPLAHPRALPQDVWPSLLRCTSLVTHVGRGARDGRRGGQPRGPGQAGLHAVDRAHPVATGALGHSAGTRGAAAPVPLAVFLYSSLPRHKSRVSHDGSRGRVCAWACCASAQAADDLLPSAPPAGRGCVWHAGCRGCRWGQGFLWRGVGWVERGKRCFPKLWLAGWHA
jgi:hypothetical protein